MRVYVTGGTGLIGSHVAERLRGRGDEVVALVRPSSDTAYLRAIGCRPVTGDMGDPPAALAEGMRDCDAVVHAAALVFQPARRGAYLRLNLTGTERVLRAASMAAPRVVHVSSVAVYAGLPPDRPLTEDRWTEAEPSRMAAYPASKHLGERAAWRLHEAGGIALTTVRPAVVYGERDRSATRVLVRLARLPVTPLPGGGRTTLPLVYAGNVARGVVEALDRPGAIGRAYNLGLDRPITARELLARVAEALGRRGWAVPVPGAALRGAAAVLDGLRRLVPFLGPGGLHRGARLLDTDNPYDSHRARLELGWTQLTAHEEGIRRTMEWWRSRGSR